ncbi:MAG TPA: transglycosylase domain-containing protein, partial [Candidatus Acidoferrales bacterium]|nr:transglycosylase domain-containing protein [Candidatus Acidoferrales bacterium]
MAGGGRKAPANPAKKSPRVWRIRGWRVRNVAAAAMLLVLFGTGFYLAQLYGEISALIEQRRAALTSAIYSAPHPIRAGDAVDRSGLLDRLTQLSYTPVAAANTPGEYSKAPRAIAIYLRAFRSGALSYPAQLVRVSLDGERITGVADSFGVAKTSAMLEPEVIGRLLPGAPAERVEVQLGQLKPYLTNGLLATEDRYFYYHPGIDPIRIAEAALADFRAHRLVQGASTLTQQLARTFMERRERSFNRKFRELAV